MANIAVTEVSIMMSPHEIAGAERFSRRFEE
jgi:hypothetical protein